jgi:hypothetical protein
MYVNECLCILKINAKIHIYIYSYINKYKYTHITIYISHRWSGCMEKKGTYVMEITYTAPKNNQIKKSIKYL